MSCIWEIRLQKRVEMALTVEHQMPFSHQCEHYKDPGVQFKL